MAGYVTNIRNISLLFPDDYMEKSKVEISDFSFEKNLGVDELVGTCCRNPSLPWEGGVYSHLDYYTSDKSVIQYRLDVLGDILENPVIYDVLKSALPQINNIIELIKYKTSGSDTASCLYSICEIELYTGCIDSLSEIMKTSCSNLKSDGLRKFADMIIAIAGSAEYTNLKSEISKLSRSVRDIKSITIGVNLDAQLKPVEAGVVSVNSTPFKSGEIIDRILRVDMKDDGYRCITPLIAYGRNMPNKDTAVYNMALNNALDTVFKSVIKSWRPAVRLYISQNTTFLVKMVDQIAFLLGAADLVKKLRALGLPMCKPEVKGTDERKFTVKGLYNPITAIKLNRIPKNHDEYKIVSNDFEFDEDGMIYILTGPNQGGKSVMTYAVGIAQALMQLGIFVPALSASISPVDGIFTHFTVEEDEAINKGRLGEECLRLQQMIGKISRNSLVLMDETLSTTSAIEGTYIASELLTGLASIGCRCIFATHLHDLSQSIEALNKKVGTGGSKIDNLVAGMTNRETGERSYKIIRRKPDGLSYAKDIAEKYGITFTKITTDLKEKNICDV